MPHIGWSCSCCLGCCARWRRPLTLRPSTAPSTVRGTCGVVLLSSSCLPYKTLSNIGLASSKSGTRFWIGISKHFNLILTSWDRVGSSWLASGGEICVWRLVPPVGHCNSLYLGSGKRRHWCFSQEDPDTSGSSKYEYYVLHLSKKQFPKNVSDLEVVKTARFSLVYPDFNVWKKVGNN